MILREWETQSKSPMGQEEEPLTNLTVNPGAPLHDGKQPRRRRSLSAQTVTWLHKTAAATRRKSFYWGEQMDRPVYLRDRRKYARYPIRLPLEYWQPDDVRRGAMVENLSEGGLLIHSHQAMPVGKELRVTIFFPNEYKFDGITALGKITWRGVRSETDWMGYRYGLEFVRISREDSEKIARLLRRPSVPEAIPIDQDFEPRSFPTEKLRLPPKAGLVLPEVKEARPRGLQER
jgi:hypothetical protein